VRVPPGGFTTHTCAENTAFVNALRGWLGLPPLNGEPAEGHPGMVRTADSWQAQNEPVCRFNLGRSRQ
jgi:hypothetical protein